MNTNSSHACVLAVIIGTMGSPAALASGFQLLEQNASGLGNAYAGSAAIADNASTVFFNPAGMTRLDGTQVSAGFNAIRPSFEFSDNGSTGPFGLPLGANQGDDAGSWGYVPNAYLSLKLSPRWHAGLGVGAPFGLKTRYDEDWMGRYQSTRFSIETININPSIAYKATDRLSIGAGVNWQQIKADYRRNVPAAGFSPLLAGAPDVRAKVKVKDDAWGWNLGLLYELNDATRVGFAYRSEIRYTATGTTSLRNIPVPLVGRVPTAENARAGVTLPDTATASLVHDLTPKWQLLADLAWTNWSSIPELRIDSGRLGEDLLELDFRDTWRFALGANYRHSPRWVFKGGVAYDQSPVHDSSVRPTALPDNGRLWLSVGAQYNVNERMTVDVGYAHLFIDDPSIDNDSDPRKGTVRGSYKDDADLFGVQASYRF